MKNNTSGKYTSQELREFAEANPGYSQIANFIDDLGLSSGENLVIKNLIRRADRKTHTCFPSHETIGRDCGMCREHVSKLVLKLAERGLIEAQKVGRHYRYVITHEIFEAIDRANQNYKSKKNAEKLGNQNSQLQQICEPHSHIENDSLEKEVKTLKTCEQGRHEYANHIRTNEDSLINKKKKTKDNPPLNPPQTATAKTGFVQEKNSLGDNGMEKQKDSASGKTISLSEANKFFQSLSSEDRRAFDFEASKLLRPDESMSMTMKRILRCRFFEELSSVHTVRREGEPAFTIPGETKAASEHIGELH